MQCEEVVCVGVGRVVAAEVQILNNKQRKQYYFYIRTRVRRNVPR